MSDLLHRKGFELKPEHIALLCSGRTYIDWDDGAYYGSFRQNPKRPYGNSDVADDIAEILGWKPGWGYDPDDDDPELSDDQYDLAMKLHEETATALEIILNCKTFEPGFYRTKSPYSIDWERVR
jgi:hypothetical protein